MNKFSANYTRTNLSICTPEGCALAPIQSFFERKAPDKERRATAKSPPEATRRRISEPCKWAASIRGLPKMFSRTIVPINAKPRPASRLLFFMQALLARVSSRDLFYPMRYCGGDAGFVSPQMERWGARRVEEAGYEPTPKGRRLLQELSTSLPRLDRLLSGENFDPRQEETTCPSSWQCCNFCVSNADRVLR
jgi:hypothetical protein